jgi:hypothetical protein
MNLSIRSRLGIWSRFDEDEGEALNSVKRDDLFITAGFTLRWRYRKVDLTASYYHNQNTVDYHEIGKAESGTDSHRLSFSLSRRF